MNSKRIKNRLIIGKRVNYGDESRFFYVSIKIKILVFFTLKRSLFLHINFSTLTFTDNNKLLVDVFFWQWVKSPDNE